MQEREGLDAPAPCPSPPRPHTTLETANRAEQCARSGRAGTHERKDGCALFGCDARAHMRGRGNPRLHRLLGGDATLKGRESRAYRDLAGEFTAAVARG